MTGLPLLSETHGGDDVPIYSRGPFAHLLTGVVHQSFIPHAIAFAACLTPPVDNFVLPLHCPGGQLQQDQGGVGLQQRELLSQEDSSRSAEQWVSSEEVSISDGTLRI
jgi:hypothetical protein